MRVCQITGEFPPAEGGVGDYTAELSRALIGAGLEIDVLTACLPQPAQARGRAVESDGEVEPCVHRVVPRWNWGSWRIMDRLLRQMVPDVVHIQYQAAAYGLHPAINLFPWRLRLSGGDRPRLMTTFHDLRVPYIFPKAGPLRWRSILALARGSDRVVVTNVRDEHRLDSSGCPCVRIPIGSNIKPPEATDYDRVALRARWGIGDVDFVVCHFGFVNRRKGIDTLLHALQILRSRTSSPGNVHLLMIGGTAGASDVTNVTYLATIRELADRLGLTTAVTWTGFMPEAEVSAAFAAADCCVLPYTEGASFQRGTLMAALAHGMAIVTTTPPQGSASSCPSELKDGENVLLVPPDQPDLLADRLALLARSPDLASRLGEGARALSGAFSWPGIAQRHLEVYDGLA